MFVTLTEVSTYCPWESMARLCKGCWWHNILHSGSFTFGLHIVTIPAHHYEEFI